MKFNIYVRWLLLGFVLSLNSFAQNVLLDKANEFITDYKEFSNQLITDLECNEYQSVLDKSQWTRVYELLLGKPTEQCCVINDLDLFDSVSKNHRSLRDKLMYLQYELSRRVGFKDDCGFTILMSASRSLKDDIVDLRKCKNDSKCNISNLNKKIRSCRISIDMFNKLISKKNRILNTQSCLQTNLIKPIVEGINTTKEPPPTLNPNFNQLFFQRLIGLKDKINNDLNQVGIDQVIIFINEIKGDLINLWTLQIVDPKSFNFNGKDMVKPICNTTRLSSKIVEINSASKWLKKCLVDNECHKRESDRRFQELIDEKIELVEMFVNNQEFKKCMQETLKN